MSFMYKTMLTRAPNKRKIKINEENILRLITTSEEEDEEDEDFTMPKQKEKEKNKDESETDGSSDEESEENVETDKSETTDTNDDQEEAQDKIQRSEKPRTSRSHETGKNLSKKHKKSITFPTGPTVADVNEYILSEHSGLPSSTVEMFVQAKKQLKQSENALANVEPWLTPLCCICLEEKTLRKQKKLITCSKCGISVHEDCYSMQIRPQRRVENSDIWLCDSCIHGGEIVCEFCPNTWGCMKETKCGRWCHIVCARNILADYLYNTVSISPKKSQRQRNTIYIQLSDCSNKLFGSKECILCEKRLVAKTGICIKCDAGFCKSTFHVTCAQKHGLLFRVSNSVDHNNNGEAYFANCPLHCNKEEMRKRQRNFILQTKTMELKKGKYDLRSVPDQNAVMTKLIQLRETKKRQRDLYLPPKPPLEQVPRLLSSDAHFTRLLNDKAEKLFGITTKSPATIIPRPTEIRKRHYVVPSLTTDFAAYYTDRQLRVEEEKSSLQSAIETNQELSQKQEWKRHKYNEIRSKLITSKFEHTDLKTNLESLKRYFLSLHQWASSSQSTKTGVKRKRMIAPHKTIKLSNPLVPIFNPPKKVVQESDSIETDGEARTTSTLPPSSNEELPEADSMFEWKTCGICKAQENQHLLVRCDVCLQWQHLGCLDPPLTQMPKRTKFSLWQCSECASSSGSSSSDCDTETHGSFLNKDGRRLTRRSHKAPDKLVNSFLNTESKIRSRKMIGHSKLKAKRQQKLRNALRDAKRSHLLQRSLEMDLPMSSLVPQKTTTASTTSESISSRKTSLANVKSTDQDLPLGISCDNYLSQAARIPIMKFGDPVQATPCVKKIPNVVVLKKAISVQPRRPAGLGRAKEKLMPSPERRPTIKIINAVSLASRTPSPPQVGDDAIPALEKIKTKQQILECGVCEKIDNQQKMITCDTCRMTYHWRCCDPPIKSNPKKMRFILWECSECVQKRDSDDDGSVKPENIQDKGCTVTPDGRRKISRRRKPPDTFEPAFTVSDQQRIFKSLERKKLKKRVFMTTPTGDTSLTAARCKPLSEHTVKSKVLVKSPSSGCSFPLMTPLTGAALEKFAGMKTISIIKKMPGSAPNVVSVVPLISAKAAAGLNLLPTSSTTKVLPGTISSTFVHSQVTKKNA